MPRSRISGAARLRRKLRRVEPAILRGIQDPLRDGLNSVGRDARSLAPVRDGDLRASIDVSLSRDKLAGVVGPGAKAAEIVRRRTGSAFKGSEVRMRKINKKLLMQFYKGYWLEFGTKGAPKRNVPPLTPRPFMRPAWDMNERRIKAAIRQGVNNALRQAASG